jgi:hypothetical protein
MLLVKTRIGPSAIHGIGIFAAEEIAEGTHIWVFHPGFDQRYDLADIRGLPSTCARQLLHYGYVNPASGHLVVCLDDARFFNHSDAPNTEELDDGLEGITVASRRIAAGEELTYDYLSGDLDGPRKLSRGDVGSAGQ